jgi:hypothetical protein
MDMAKGKGSPPSPLFSQVFILKGVKVICFDTLLQVLILKGVSCERKCGSQWAKVTFRLGLLVRADK